MKDFSNVKFKWTFRDYQQAVLDNSQKHLKDKRIHIVAAPGSGKTILGLELVRRQNAPTLVMSPSVTIRQQWGERFVEAYLPETENPDEYISYSLTNPKLITSITYQALHAAFTKSVMESEADEDEFEAEETQDFSNFDLLSEIKKAGIKTICLDEAHHLKSEWQKALEKFVAMLGDGVTVIALTATPPYDSAPAEWNRYHTLCGDIDEEIFVPQLVMQKTLCPHQDYIYFSYPTAEESQILANYKAKASAVTDEIIRSGLLSKALQVSDAAGNEEILYDNLAGFKSLVCVAKQGNANISKSLEEKVFEGRKAPVYSIAEAEKAFQFIIDKPDVFSEEISEELKAILSKEALIEKRKVRLASNDKINKMLVSSTGKLGSINKIVASEYVNLGDSLRMLILTDYIKKDMLKLVGTNEEIHALGTVPVFESIRRTNPDIKVAVLSGTLVILPDSAVETAQKIAYNEGVPCRIKKLENTNHTEIIFSGSNKNKVSIITKAFQLGVINVLIGTKSLLGEGWDSPNINSLILASFVGSFMLSNQMRGRAIRIDKKNPEKVSNIWHLVTVEPDSKDEIISDDFETMKRRFACFQAPAYNSDIIESGTDRIDILKAPYDANGLESINNQMLSLASSRNVMAGRWNGAVKGKARPEIEEVSEIPAEVQPASAVHKNKIYAIVLAVLIVLAIIIIATSGFFGGLIGFIIAAISSVLLIKSASVVMKNSSPEKTVSNISNAILRTLKEIGEIESRGATVSVKKSEKKNTVNCSLSKATVREKNVFAKAISELLSPIDDPRYLLIGTKGISKFTSRNYIQSYACPSVIAVNKETAEILAKNLRSAGGKFELVFTRNENGRKELFKCRKYSYINANSRFVKNKKIVK
ncbi:MAG: DEAD/DEAH box helicase family protein [Clostridia bacterium]|nr:DEAD/DEAH box helicase family protein [Clostridia bacterium]